MSDAVVDFHFDVTNGKSFDEIWIVPEDVVGVADRENGGDDFQVIFGGDFFDALDIFEIARVHVVEFGEFGIGKENVGITGFAGAGEKLLEVVDVFIDPKILGAIEPEFAAACLDGDERDNREQN